jgi:hypothetical protein
MVSIQLVTGAATQWLGVTFIIILIENSYHYVTGIENGLCYKTVSPTHFLVLAVNCNSG